MTSIQNTSQIAAIIRSQISQLKNSQSPRITQSKKYEKKTVANEPSESEPDVAEVITLRISQIDKLDPDRVSKAFRIFLESILIAEFGSQLINDPRFFQMIDSIKSQMQGDAELSEMIKSAMESVFNGSE